MDITSVADDLIVCHDKTTVTRLTDLQPATTYSLNGAQIATLPRPSGELLCRFATVNDLHFGEVDCGAVDDRRGGPVERVADDEQPYAQMMSEAAVKEIDAIAPVAVVVKGDLSLDGAQHEWQSFEDCYRPVFGDRLHVVRGNHDAYHGQTAYTGDQWIEVPGLAIALLDTVVPEHTTGRITANQLEWLDTHCAAADRPVLVMGHHQQWIGSSGKRAQDYFGLDPDSSDGLNDVASHRTCIVGYTAGHTHRHRVRRMACGIPSIEVGCVKDFPGTWAEYRVFEGGIMQVVHRMSTVEALRWSERCRHLYRDFGIDYESYALGALEDRCCNIPLR